MKSSNFRCILWNKNEKMFQIDLGSDLKEENDLKEAGLHYLDR